MPPHSQRARYPPAPLLSPLLTISMRAPAVARALLVAGAVALGWQHTSLSFAQRLHPSALTDLSPLETDGNGARFLVEAEGEAALAHQADGDADDEVTDLPGLDPTAKVAHHAGRVTLDDGDKNKLFYWHFPAASDPDKAPLVIWLNGGPGCSSMQGLFLGISPFKLLDDTTVGINDFSWHHAANLLFLDQPVGTGMSFTRGNDYRTDEETVASDFYQFLQKFLRLHDEYVEEEESPTGGDNATDASTRKRSRPLFIFGESHAGRYIPNFSSYILEQNNKNAGDSSDDVAIRLEGVAIGNGWVHPRVQYDYSDFAHGLGLLTFGQVRSLKTAFSECTDNLDAGNFFSQSCLGNMDSIMGSIKTGKGGKSLNYYDVRQYVRSVSAYPDGQNAITSFLNQASVREALHANTEHGFRFDVCSNEVYRGLAQFDGVSTLEKMQVLLRSGLRVLFYNGQWDMMCNHYNTEKLLLHLDWDGAAAYQDADKYTWTVEGLKEPAGFAQQGGNLTYLVVTGAGHMVPMDMPQAAADMAKRFIQNLEFDDKAQTVENAKMNATDLEPTHCSVPDASSTALSSTADAPSTASSVSSTSTTTTSAASPSLGAAWLWITALVAVISSALAVVVTIMCVRDRQSHVPGHSMVTQESDEEGEIPMASPLGELDSFTVTKQQPEEEDDEDDEGAGGLSDVDLESATRSPLVKVGTEVDL